MQNKPSKWVSGYKHGPAASYTQITRMGLFLNVSTSKFEPLDSTWDNLHSGGMFISDDNKIYFRDETNNDIYINSNADNEITIAATSGVTISGGNLIIGTAGKGIDFSVQTATATGTTTSELLDHYEEGTWDGVFYDNNGTPRACTMDGNFDTGRYTRIGRQVFVQGYFGVSSLGSASGNLLLHGLPFTVGTSSGYNADCYNGFSIGWGSSLGITAEVALSARVVVGTDRLDFSKWSATTGTEAMTCAELTADGYISFSGTYTV